MTTHQNTSVDSFMVPQEKISIDHINKKIAKRAGISIKLLKPYSSNHLTFQVRLEFAGGRQIILFEKISLEIKREWKNSSGIREIIEEILNGNNENIPVLRKFITDSVYFRVEVKTSGTLAFHLAVHAPSTVQNYTDYGGTVTKHHNDVVGWLRDIE